MPWLWLQKQPLHVRAIFESYTLSTPPSLWSQAQDQSSNLNKNYNSSSDGSRHVACSHSAFPKHVSSNKLFTGLARDASADQENKAPSGLDSNGTQKRYSYSKMSGRLDLAGQSSLSSGSRPAVNKLSGSSASTARPPWNGGGGVAGAGPKKSGLRQSSPPVRKDGVGGRKGDDLRNHNPYRKPGGANVGRVEQPQRNNFVSEKRTGDAISGHIPPISTPKGIPRL